MCLKKGKILMILHCPPPNHGASAVGEYILKKSSLSDHFEIDHVRIDSSNDISEIGKFSFKKIVKLTVFYWTIIKMLLRFKPDGIYFTSSISGLAFYRDFLVSLLFKVYFLIKRKTIIFYHYHTKGINEFIEKSRFNLNLTKFFVSGVDLILLSPLFSPEFNSIETYRKIHFLPNGIQSDLSDEEFEKLCSKKFKRGSKSINILFLGHMILDKGYLEVLELASITKDLNLHFHFAGSWGSEMDTETFNHFVISNNLNDIVTYHGFVDGCMKRRLLESSSMYITLTKNDAFPLTIIECLSYGIPIVATNEGAISSMINTDTGVVIDDSVNIEEVFRRFLNTHLFKETALKCRERYKRNFTQSSFDQNLVRIIKSEVNV